MKLSTRSMILIAEFAAIIAVLSQLTFPLGLIPLTGQTLAIGLAVTVLGRKNGTYAILIYLLLGLIGLPVFAGMSSGISVLFGPTGGYLVGFLINGLVTGEFLDRTSYTYKNAVIANLLGAAFTLLFGTAWLKLSGGMTWSGAFQGGFLPFILPGAIKAIAAAYLGILIRQRLPFFSETSKRSV